LAQELVLNEEFAETEKLQRRSRRFPQPLEVRQNRHGFVNIRGCMFAARDQKDAP
jgi:hypothetical protein